MTVMERRFKTLSEALHADSDYLTKLANKPSMRNYCQEIINATVDINRAAFELEKKTKTGKWLAEAGDDAFIGYWRCSECKKPYPNDTPFCPWCGIEME